MSNNLATSVDSNVNVDDSTSLIANPVPAVEPSNNSQPNIDKGPIVIAEAEKPL